MHRLLLIFLLNFVFLGQAFAAQNLVSIVSIDETIVIDMPYATENNFTKKILYSAPVCYVHRDLIEPLRAIQAELRNYGFGLKVWDAYRPPSVQRLMWDLVPDERYVSNPHKEGGRHTRGIAIDVTLVDLKTGQEVEMPTGFDDFSLAARADAPVESCVAFSNRTMLHDVMSKHGFTVNPDEWWHFNFKNWQSYPVLNHSIEELVELDSVTRDTGQYQ